MTDTQTALDALAELAAMAAMAAEHPHTDGKTPERVSLIRAALQSRTEQEPIPVHIYCPECRALHLDEGEWATRPHKTHQCQSCGHEWRPFEFPTVGVAPPRTEQEPVAWRWRPKGTDRWIYDPNFEWLNSQLDSDVDKEPIYASPPDQSARIAELEAEKRELLEAIRPFAAYAKAHQDVRHPKSTVPKEGPLWGLNVGSNVEAIITVEDLDATANLHNKLKEK